MLSLNAILVTLNHANVVAIDWFIVHHELRCDRTFNCVMPLQLNMLIHEYPCDRPDCLWTSSWLTLLICKYLHNQTAIIYCNFRCKWTWLFVHSHATKLIVVFVWHHYKWTCKLLKCNSQSLKGILEDWMKDEGDHLLGARWSWLDDRSLASLGTLVQRPFQSWQKWWMNLDGK